MEDSMPLAPKQLLSEDKLKYITGDTWNVCVCVCMSIYVYMHILVYNACALASDGTDFKTVFTKPF